jgi:hypothetical protein
VQPRNRAARVAVDALPLGCATPAAAQEGVGWSGAMAKREIDKGFVPRRS